jgi:hypothetical protein
MLDERDAGMTNQQVLSAIDSAAEQVALASFDVHSPVRPQVGWDVVREMWAEADDQRLGLLPNSMPPEFERAYARHVAVIASALKKNYVRIVNGFYEIYLPVDRGKLSYRTDRLFDAIGFVRRFTQVSH